jgi:molecular chaperone GrpE
MVKEDERDADDGEEPEDDEGYLLDLDEEEEVDLDALAREAAEAVDRVDRRVADPAVEEMSISRLEEELEELRDRSIRTLADFENYRRRAERERDELRRYAAFEAMSDFLPVLDNLERALSAGGSADDVRVGVEMILRQMRDLLRQRGVAPVEALGQPFDPTIHEAVARDEDPDVDVPTVIEEMQRGYRMHDRLLRPALVKVAMPVPDSDE